MIFCNVRGILANRLAGLGDLIDWVRVTVTTHVSLTTRISLQHNLATDRQIFSSSHNPAWTGTGNKQ